MGDRCCYRLSLSVIVLASFLALRGWVGRFLKINRPHVPQAVGIVYKKRP